MRILIALAWRTGGWVKSRLRTEATDACAFTDLPAQQRQRTGWIVMNPTPASPSFDPSTQDAAQLDLLGIFHYVVAGLSALFSLFPVIHLVIGLAMVTGHMGAMHARAGEPDPALFGWFFVVIAVLIIACGLTFSALLAYAGRCLRQRRRHTFCLVMAAISCAFMPFGTVLGVFTLIALSKPSAKSLFASK
jgi:hypothetical protein